MEPQRLLAIGQRHTITNETCTLDRGRQLRHLGGREIAALDAAEPGLGSHEHVHQIGPLRLGLPPLGAVARVGQKQLRQVLDFFGSECVEEPLQRARTP